jgi:hypothetical protein
MQEAAAASDVDFSEESGEDALLKRALHLAVLDAMTGKYSSAANRAVAGGRG